MLLEKYPELHRHYLGNHFWNIDYGCWSIGHLTEKLLHSYLDHHGEQPNADENFILE
jgi:putative transposase